MKRWGFSGQPASHGNSLTHRAMGSAGQSQGGGSRVLPGKRMAGRMGGQQHTVQNLKVLQVDPELGIVIVNGTSRQETQWDSMYGTLTSLVCRSGERTQGLCGGVAGRDQEAYARGGSCGGTMT